MLLFDREFGEWDDVGVMGVLFFVGFRVVGVRVGGGGVVGVGGGRDGAEGEGCATVVLEL